MLSFFNLKRGALWFGGVVAVTALTVLAYAYRPAQPLPHKDVATQKESPAPIIHKTTATMFWVGEVADDSNANIPNHESAWMGDWIGAYGGVDDPNRRCNLLPCDFAPLENPFYVALPFNDKMSDGKSRPEEVLRRIPWYNGVSNEGESLMKNRWVKVVKGDKTGYGQVEDVGPMNEDDVDYVFGDHPPKFYAGIDLSPALANLLELGGRGQVTWEFVEESAVPDGPWKKTITVSQINY